ncbi:MAG: phosphoribosylamine--glycine ligase [Bryobacteraceae bacterium]
MKILVVGSGGREHALVWRLAQSPAPIELYASPGNPGMARIAQCISPPSPTPEGFLAVAETVSADLTVVGPEAPLVEGIVDLFQARRLRIVGPSASAAKLEGSKIFAKEAMRRFGVPTAAYTTVHNLQDALHELSRFSCPVVLKADGLAAGKGVCIARTREEATKTAEALMSGSLVGEAGRSLVIEEFLEGEEVSFIALSDGTHVVPLEPTQDHKAVFDGDQGPNTGGMGAYCDSRILTPRQHDLILERVIHPVIEGMRREGRPFTGFLYAGLMMVEGEPKVLEFNVRLGDPETQALMHRMDDDLVPLLEAAAVGDLRPGSIRWRSGPSVCVVLAAAGYPGTPRKGDPISGIEEAESLGASVFHAATRLENGRLVTAGGRVLGVTAAGPDLPSAIENTYAAVNRIHFEGMHYRRDIGFKGLKRWPALE